MVMITGKSYAGTLEEFKRDVRKHIARLQEEGFFQSEIAHQKALDNVNSLTEEDWERMNTGEPQNKPGVTH